VSIIHAVTSGVCMLVWIGIGMHTHVLNLNTCCTKSVLLPLDSRLESRPLARDLGIGKGISLFRLGLFGRVKVAC